MRQTHTPGGRLFIDYAGQTVGVTDGSTSEIRTAQVFVAVLGASNYTYIEATWSQQLPDWIGSHVRALSFFGGCTESSSWGKEIRAFGRRRACLRPAPSQNTRNASS